MDVSEAISTRKSIRAFSNKPVPRKILEGLMEKALRAPSWSNIQPWEFAVASGAPLSEIQNKCLALADEPPVPDIPSPTAFPEPYDTRRRTVVKQFLGARGIGREDKEARRQFILRAWQHFGAPCVIYICIERSFFYQEDATNAWALFDCALVAENIMLLALEQGLGTIPQAQAVAHPEIIRQTLTIPDTKLLALGIPIGYPVTGDPINQFLSERAELAEVSTWHGF